MPFSPSEQLINAIVANDISTVKKLLADGVDPNYQTTQGYTALHIAAQQQLPEVIQLLIEHDALIDSEDNFGNTPLGTATFNSRGDGVVIKMLLANGANPNHKNHSGKSPRELAEIIGNYDVKQYYM